MTDHSDKKGPDQTADASYAQRHSVTWPYVQILDI